MLFDKFENRTIISGELVAVDPVHIGASEKESLNPVNLDFPLLKDSAGNPLIPGSSVKGVVRSRFEAVMCSAGKEICDIFDNSPENCVSNKLMSEISADMKLSDYEKAEALYENSCTVCKLFGGRKSRGFGTVSLTAFRLVVSNGFDSSLKPVIPAEYNRLDTLLNELEGGKFSLPTEELYE